MPNLTAKQELLAKLAAKITVGLQANLNASKWTLGQNPQVLDKMAALSMELAKKIYELAALEP